MLKETLQVAPDELPWRISTLRNAGGMVVTLMDWGATLLSCRVPLSNGSVRETLLGCASPEAYQNQSAYLGATVGRYANRIANAQFTLNGQQITLAANQGPNQLHGGPGGFDKRRWRVLQQNESEAVFALESLDGDQGFPGECRVTAHYRVTEDNRLEIEYRAQVTQACPVNLTNHAYFNLDDNQNDVREHELQVFADSYLPIDASGIPTQGLCPVENTGFDFRRPKPIIQDFLKDEGQQIVNGYDHAFLLTARGDVSHPAAQVWSSDKRLKMTVYTSAPALQVYTGNFLAGTPAREQGEYANWQGLALESEFLPDSPNHPEWPQPNVMLAPEQEYVSITHYCFSAA
ncbi:galactose-1-epimerase [Erwinia sp. HR93]|uniref:galactose-1-epimerase n=1 Tax=Erwinia sp. HR93 TaxID=3094840 RepID=UPI002ADEC0CE|nr:galactose-1-epimerase [Erwinia sp. HR93]MEA1064471.1 galactose-1-epimerase [Erwinia sp. HR93]